MILSINPAYPQKKPDLTAEIVSIPMTFLIFFKSIFGIKLLYQKVYLSDNLTPGAIMPPE